MSNGDISMPLSFGKDVPWLASSLISIVPFLYGLLSLLGVIKVYFKTWSPKSDSPVSYLCMYFETITGEPPSEYVPIKLG